MQRPGVQHQVPQSRRPLGDIPEKFVKPTAQNDYVKRTQMIPMRDGVKLYTVIVIPKGRPQRTDHPLAYALQRRLARLE